MSKAIAFFPWVTFGEVQAFGTLRLIPYRTSEKGRLQEADRGDIDGVLSRYVGHGGLPITETTLVEFDEWETGMAVGDEEVDRLFFLQKLVVFAALSGRRLFDAMNFYTNADTFQLVIQKYRPGSAANFVYSTRRRDLPATNHVVGGGFSFYRPPHVSPGKARLDGPLLRALATLDAVPDRWHKAIVDYCAANTDSKDMPEHTEAVLMLCAFEWLLGFKHADVESFVRELNVLFPTGSATYNGPLHGAWQCYRKKRHLTEVRPLEAWAREFCQVRGQSAHGQSRDAKRFVWPVRAHLAFASILFPLAFKVVMANEGWFALSDADLRRAESIDEYVLHDPVAKEFQRGSHASHPWVLIEEDIELHAMVVQSIKELGRR